MNANEVLQATMDEMAARLVGKFTDPDELLEALGGDYEVVEVVRWTGNPGKQYVVRGANGREASIWSDSAYVYEARAEEAAA